MADSASAGNGLPDSVVTEAPAYLPRRGTELETAAPGVIANRSLDTPAAIAIEAFTR